MTFEFLCAGLNFETSDLVTFSLSEGQLLRPSGLVELKLHNKVIGVNIYNSCLAIEFFLFANLKVLLSKSRKSESRVESSSMTDDYNAYHHTGRCCSCWFRARQFLLLTPLNFGIVMTQRKCG